METMFGVTDAFVAVKIWQTTRDTHGIWRKSRQIDSRAIQRIKTQFRTTIMGAVDEQKALLNANKLEEMFQSVIISPD